MSRLLRFSALLVLPLVFLLFVQWPLRDWMQVSPRLANDVAQVIFAVYVAVAVTAASRARTHLSAHRPLHAAGGAASWRAWALLACVGPWSGFVLWSGGPQIVASVVGLEKFSETLTPGYFLVKLAMGLMLLLVAVEAILGVLEGRHARPGADG